MRWWIGLIWCFCMPAWADDVLVIQSYHSGYAWDASYIQGLKEGIKPPHQLHFFEMNTKRSRCENTVQPLSGLFKPIRR